MDIGKTLTRWRILPRYGNWGGIGYSGGTFPDAPAQTNWDVPAVDTMDELFKQHDKLYQYAIEHCPTIEYRNADWEFADQWLVCSLLDIPIDPGKWERPPRSKLYARIFRYFSIGIFWLKIKLL